ncbi:isochorismatase family protein [Vibrio sp. M260118]|uniref:isochorismatase family protein n=1 Tax=Vibrio sp. M260118 TaxID=3020896 RepID=UPI002F3F589A
MLSKDNTGLIVVDVQGKLARLVHDSEALISNCASLIVGARELGLPIVLLEQNPEKLGSTVEELQVHLTGVSPISKFTFSACESADFIATIKNSNVDTWLVCGIEAHICVYQTAKGLAELGLNVELVSDCVSSRKLSNVQLAIRRLEAIGVGITGVEMCL